jgi:hypothetical protein
MVERIFLKDANQLQIDTTILDDELFTGPYLYSRVYQRTPLPMTYPSCTQSNRDNDVTMDLTPPPAP